MTGPIRIQRQRTKDWRMPANTVCVCRPSIWGNPYTHPDPAKAVDAFRKHCQPGTKIFEMGPGGLQFAKGAHQNSLHWAYAEYVRDYIHELRGKNLACWCLTDQPCHADVLLDLANAPQVSA